MNTRRLFRSRTDRTIAGVAGGMAEYLDIDPTVVRLLWILGTIFTGGLGLLVYIVLAFVVPLNPYPGGMMPAGAGYAGQPQWTPPAGYAAGGAYGPGAAPAAGTPYGGATGATPAGSTTWNPGWDADWNSRYARRAERRGRAGLIIGTVLIVIGVIALADVAIPGWVARPLIGPAILLAIGAAFLVASVGRRDAHRPSAEIPPVPRATEPAPAVEPAPPAPPADAYESDVTTTIPTQAGPDLS